MANTKQHKTDPKIYMPISRIDEAERMVYGYGTREDLKDSYGTIIDLDSVKRAIPNYMKWRNIREMHQPSAVGRADEITVDEKGVYLGVKVVDDAAWKKVLEKVYRGFSIGGKKDYQEGDRIYLRGITEFSLVDRPSNEGCGIDEFRIFDTDTVENPTRKEGENMSEKETEVQAAGTPDLKRYLGEEVMDASKAIQALGDLTFLLAKEESEDHAEAEGQIADLKTVIEKLKSFIASEIMEEDEKDEGEVIMSDNADVERGDYPGHEFHGNQHIGASGSGAENKASKAAHESSKGAKDEKSHAAAAKAHTKAANAHDKAGHEETAAYHNAMAHYHAKSASLEKMKSEKRSDTADVQRKGAAISKENAGKLQAMHDHCVDMGARCDRANAVDKESAIAGRADNADVTRLATLESDVQRMSGELSTLKEEAEKDKAEIKRLMAMPKPAIGVSNAHAVTKEQDGKGVNHSSKDIQRLEDTEEFKAASREEQSKMLMRKALENPIIIRTQ